MNASRTAVTVALLVLGCAEPTTCLPTLDAGVQDASMCARTLVLGPVLVSPYPNPMAGGGVPISAYPARDLRIRLFRMDGSPSLDVVRTSSGTDYLVVPTVEPGDYLAAIDVVGTSLVVGADVLPGGCPSGLEASPWCRAIRVTVGECGTAIVPAAMGCTDTTEATCGGLP